MSDILLNNVTIKNNTGDINLPIFCVFYDQIIGATIGNSNLCAVGYDGQTLRIQFHSGGVYDYLNVPESVYHGLMNAASKGSYHAAHIKNAYTYRKIR